MPLTLSRRWRSFFFLAWPILLVGCGAGSLPTPTIEVLPSATPTPSVSYVHLKNAASGTYLYAAAGQAKLAELSTSDPAFDWTIEDYEGSQRIQNRASGNYLSIEHLQAYVEVIPIEPVWMSPRWTFETDAATGSVVLRNVWHNWQILYVKDGQVTYDRFSTTDNASHWIFESSDGSALATSTAAPVVVLPTAAQPADNPGASVPWIEYEAEESQSNGETLTPDRTFGTVASESSGRSAVKLDKTGEYLQFQATEAANSVVVRYVIPDSEDGHGQAAT